MPFQKCPTGSISGVAVVPFLIRLSEGDVYQASSFQGCVLKARPVAKPR